MGFDDPLDGFEHAVVCVSFSFSSVADLLGLCVSKLSVLRAFLPLFYHL